MTQHRLLTSEQIAILDEVRASTTNLMLNAYAGCGKTSTLEMIDKAAKQKPALYLVFNKRNADEATERMLSTTTVRTFNSLGHRIWGQAIGKNLKLDSQKTYKLFKELADEVKGEAAREVWNSYEGVKQGIELGKAIGYVPDGIYPNASRLATRNALHAKLDEEPDDLTSDLIDALLRRSITAAYNGEIDFNDQVYMSALFGGTYPKFPLTLVDEYQDLSPVNHEMIRKLVGDRRLIGVGDPHQNIYGFRGAKAGGMVEAVTKFKMTEMDLSISFRCPSAIVRNAQWHVPQFKWFREGGSVEHLGIIASDQIPDSSVFICRLNAPLFALAMRLIGSGRGVSIVGSDIGPRLIKTMTKLGDSSMSSAAVLTAIDEWLEIKLAKESKTAEDTAACMRVFAGHGSDLGQAIRYAEHLFAQRGSIQLMTGHKSKGLEFPNVYHLDPALIRDSVQERNIRYVIQTRSSDRYSEISSSDIQW
jgi:superfamily I DNA/RNA helicase